MFQPQQILTDRYQLQQALGHTPLGRQTWLTLDLHSQEQVIIKLLAFSPQMQWEELKLFEREAQILQSLQHPRIPHYRDYFELDKTVGEGVCWFVLVQDYIPGNSLQDLLDQNKHFSETEIRTFAEEILDILIYLHELKPPVLHRDIKPSNLILGEDNHIYLIDFGAVQGQTNVTGMTFTVVGTSGYAPLEQFWGRAVPSSDVYALGATLIHLLTGVSPIDLPQENSQIKFADRVTIKADLLQWIQKATQMAVENRFRSAKEALDILQSGKIERPKTTSYNKLKLIKPFYSRIILNKNTELMLITLPRSFKFRIDFIKLIFALIILLIFIPISIFISVSLFTTYVIILLITVAINLLSNAINLLPKLINTKVIFKNLFFEINGKFFGINIYKQKGYVNDIIGIFLYENKKREYQVKIRTKNQNYILGENLQEEEAAWLAQEIQDWLQ